MSVTIGLMIMISNRLHEAELAMRNALERGLSAEICALLAERYVYLMSLARGLNLH
jgi:hypothetical protein